MNQDWPQKIGMQNVPGTHFPTLTFSGPAEQGGSNRGRRTAGVGQRRRVKYNGSTIGQDDLTIIRGRHNIKFGFEQRRYYYNNRNLSSSGTYTFSPEQHRRCRDSPPRPATRSPASCWERRPAPAAG